MEAIQVESPAVVRAAIARVMLGIPSVVPELGSICLKPHQASAVGRLIDALHEFGGALLCDQVGMGKTFVALAIARRFARPLVVAPASLSLMWRDALARTGVHVEFITYERLSRSDLPGSPPDLLILDEAHHARNPRARRYRRIAKLARNARVLMLTATPVHNRRADLEALLSLFLGSRAKALSQCELGRCVLRRNGAAIKSSFPQVLRPLAYDVPDAPSVVSRLVSLPPPIPVRGGGPAGPLINRGLVHQWSSSEAALGDALRRRVAKASALIVSLKAGRYPSAAELRSWTFAEGALQLGFPELLAPAATESAALLNSIDTHAHALASFLHEYDGPFLIDEARAECLTDIRRQHPHSKIIAFAQYSSTISALYRRLARTGRIAMLTANGAFVSGGKLSRQDAIERFAPRANARRPPSPAEAIDLLLATDLLSEGVNLQDAEVVVHLDVPWTAARMEQRVGRVARLGSAHGKIRVYQLRPPASAERVLHGQVTVERKWEKARALVGANGGHPFSVSAWDESQTSSIPSRAEQLRALLAGWTNVTMDWETTETIPAAAIATGQAGFLAAGKIGQTPILLSYLAGRVADGLDAQIAACQLAVEGNAAAADCSDYVSARASILGWAEHAEASESAGGAVAMPAPRRRLLNRINSALQNAPPHLRPIRARLVAAAREVASATHGAAVEQELDVLADSDLEEDEWLRAVAGTSASNQRTEMRHRPTFELRALLLFKA